MKPVHFVSISGGKDSTAVACLAKERAERRDMEIRYLFADTGNEHPLTLEHVAYLGDALGVTIETVRADLAHKFPARREAIARDWLVERREKRHTDECRRRCAEDLSFAESVVFRQGCDCPVKISPILPPELVAEAVQAMQPTGNPFLDMAMLSGRFPGSKSRFCTEILKLEPMAAVKDAVRFGPQGRSVIEWIGERAEESKARAAKPAIERVDCSFRAPAILYRPIHKLKARETFEIAKRHGIKPNPLYLMGMGRVGCMPCIMARKGEIREIARRFPDQIERIERWEAIVGRVARHALTSYNSGDRRELVSSFLPVDRVPANVAGDERATIRRAVEWARTGKGGRNFDLLNVLDDVEHDDAPTRCLSDYGLCE
jgi:3'-phosphoadenosine 5'-phosphosulfate sulfotransferase (PAPS reductase)/FAD synthetase